jgi:hypothetical protein
MMVVTMQKVYNRLSLSSIIAAIKSRLPKNEIFHDFRTLTGMRLSLIIGMIEKLLAAGR